MGMTGALKGVILTAESGEGDSTGWRPGTGLLLPMANVSMIERILDEYERAGVRETLIAAGNDTREVPSICGNGARWNMVLTYPDHVESHSPHEIMKEVAAFTGEAGFLATRGPVLLGAAAYQRAVQMYEESVREESGLRGIRLWSRNEHVTDDGHGSEGSDGIYLLAPGFQGFSDSSGGAGDRAGSFDSILDTLAGRGDRVPTMPVMATEDEPYRTDTPEAYLESNERLLESTAVDNVAVDTVPPEIMDDNFSSPNLVLRPPVALDGTAELERCRIGPGVCIGPGVRIGHGAAIEHSVIMEGADIGDGASISRAIIGKNASIENRSVMHGRAERVIVVRSRWSV